MSWIFGYGKKNDQGQSFQPPPGDGNAAVPPVGDMGLSKAEKKVMEAYRFDSSALERAAQAARELEQSSMIISRLMFDSFGNTNLLKNMPKKLWSCLSNKKLPSKLNNRLR